MPILRVLPRRGTALRALLASLEVTTVLVLGHLWAGGALPSPAWIALMAAAVLGAGLLVLRGRVPVRVAVPALAAVQLLLHAWLTVLAPAPEHAAHVGHGADLGAVLDPAMLLVHLAGALVTALVWEVRARAVEVVVTWAATGLPPLPRLLDVAPAAPRVRPTRRLTVTAAPRRGPPAPLLPV